MDLVVGGNTFITQQGTKIELGTASDHIVIYVNTNDIEQSKTTIERSIQMHNYAKDLKSGNIQFPKKE